MIRTEAAQLTSIKGLAYKQKLAAGGAGITIITPDNKAVFTINKRDGSCVPYGQADGEVFTAAAVKEALALTSGLPYKRLGNIAKVYADNRCDELPAGQDEPDEKDAADVIASAEYNAFIAQYTDKTGKFSYQLMNKDLIQFAARSSVVKTMLAENTGADNAVKYIVKSKAADLAKNKGMSDSMLSAFIDTFDSMNTRSAFKELKSHLRGKLSNTKPRQKQ